MTEVASPDVVRIVLQYLHESGFHATTQVLQEESRVTLDAVPSVDAFLSDVTAGRWEQVLGQLAVLSLPMELLQDLYEHVVLEMVEAHDKEIAAALLQAFPLQVMYNDHTMRYMRLEQLVKRKVQEGERLFEPSKEKRRHKLAQLCQPHVAQVKAGRLLTLVQQAQRWKEHVGAADAPLLGEKQGSVNLAGPQAVVGRDDLKLQRTLKFDDELSHKESCAFSPDGTMLATGAKDGFIEIWDPATGQLREDLPYQAAEEFLLHDATVQT